MRIRSDGPPDAHGAPHLPPIEVQIAWAHHRQPERPAVLSSNRGTAYGLLLVERRCATVAGTGQRWEITEGTAFLRPPYAPFDFHFEAGGAFLTMGFHARLAGVVDLPGILEPPVAWHPAEADALLMRHCLARVAAECPGGDPRESPVAGGLASALFGLCWQALAPQRLAGTPILSVPEWLARTTHLVADDPTLSVSELSGRIGYSEAHLRRLFHQAVGMSPQAFLQRYRLGIACRLLEATQIPVALVAERSGFGDLSHFGRLFRAAFGLSPRRYRGVSKYPRV